MALAVAVASVGAVAREGAFAVACAVAAAGPGGGAARSANSRWTVSLRGGKAAERAARMGVGAIAAVCEGADRRVGS